MLPLLHSLTEELDKKVLLKWQQAVIDILPANFDVELGERPRHKDTEPAIIVTRNGKELFDLSVDRADSNFIDEVTVHGDCIRKHDYIRLSASKLTTELPFFLRVYELYRKLNNLYSSKAKPIHIIKPEGGKPGVELELKFDTEWVMIALDRDFGAKVFKHKGSFSKLVTVGTTKKGEDAIFALVEKALA